MSQGYYEGDISRAREKGSPKLSASDRWILEEFTRQNDQIVYKMKEIFERFNGRLRDLGLQNRSTHTPKIVNRRN